MSWVNSDPSAPPWTTTTPPSFTLALFFQAAACMRESWQVILSSPLLVLWGCEPAQKHPTIVPLHFGPDL